MSSDTLGFQNPTTTNKRLDAERVVRDSVEVLREGVFLAGDRADAIAKIRSDTASTADWGLVVRSLMDTRLDSINDSVNTVQQGACYTAAFSLSGPNGIALEIVGSATKTVKVLEFYISKPSAETSLTITKRSTASSGGVSTTPTKVPNLSSNAAASATFKAFTSAPTAGTAIGQVFNDVVATSDRLHLKYADNNAQPLTLSGASEAITFEAGVAAFYRGHLTWMES